MRHRVSKLSQVYFSNMDRQLYGFSQQKKPKQFYMLSPSYDDELREEIYTNQKWVNLRPSRKWGKYGRCTTNIYEQEIQQAAKEQSWMVVLIEGPMDSGKSALAYSIGKDLSYQINLNTGKLVDIRFWRGKTDYLDAMQIGTLQAGDINIIDEFGDMSGVGAATETIALNNTIKMTRQAGLLRTIIISPSFTDNQRAKFAKIASFILKMAGSLSYREYCPYCKEETKFWHERCLQCQRKHPIKTTEWERNRVTRTIHFKATNRPRGFTYHPIPTDQILRDCGYMEFKSSHTLDTIRNRGMVVRVFTQDQRERYARRFIDQVITQDPYFDPATDIKISVLKTFKDHIPLQGALQDAVVTYAYRILKQEYKGESKNRITVKTTPKIQASSSPLLDTGFTQYLLRYTKSQYPKINQILHMIIDGYSRDDIATKFNVRTDTISGWIRVWAQHKDKGRVFETYFRQLVNDKRKRLTLAKANTPDAIGKDGTIYSLKSIYLVYNKSQSFIPDRDFAPEWKLALEKEKTFWFVATVPLLHKHLIYIEIDPTAFNQTITINPRTGQLTAK